MKLMPLGPVNANAFTTDVLTPAEIAGNNTFPANYVKQILIDPNFYVERRAKLEERFAALIQR